MMPKELKPMTTFGAPVALMVSAIATLLSAFAVPLVTPLFALAGVAASINHVRRGGGVVRWSPLAIFAMALVISLAIDLVLLAASTGDIHTSPAVAPVN